MSQASGSCSHSGAKVTVVQHIVPIYNSRGMLRDERIILERDFACPQCGHRWSDQVVDLRSWAEPGWRPKKEKQ